MLTARINGITPDVGTILPAGRWGGHSVVYEVDETGCNIRPATTDDLMAMQRRLTADDGDGPRSIAERKFPFVKKSRG